MNNYKKNLNIIIAENVLTSIGIGFSAAIITVFWNSIGMNQADIGFVQMIYTIVVLSFDIPMSYIADRFNRKILNIIGDIGVAFVFIMYSLSNSMFMVIVSESLLAIFTASTNGVDNSFIKYNCDRLDSSGNLLKKVNAKVNTLRCIALLITVVLGGFISKYSLRLTIGISFLPYFIGGILAFKIKDFNEKFEMENKNPLKNMASYIRQIMENKKTRLYLITYILGKEITHTQVFLFTPLLLMCGVPIELVSIGWVLNQFMQIIGSKIAEKTTYLKTSQKFAIPILIEATWIIILIVKTNIITVWLFALNGLVHGIVQGSLITPLQQSAKLEVQTGVMSVASTGAKLLYMPLIYFINYLANFKLIYGLIGVISIFMPLCIIAFLRVIKLEKEQSIKLLGDGKLVLN